MSLTPKPKLIRVPVVCYSCHVGRNSEGPNLPFDSEADLKKVIGLKGHDGKSLLNVIIERMALPSKDSKVMPPNDSSHSLSNEDAMTFYNYLQNLKPNNDLSHELRESFVKKFSRNPARDADEQLFKPSH